MMVCVPQTEAEAGGSGTFRRLWRAWLTAQGIPWTSDIHATYDILFLNAWQTSYAHSYAAKRRLPHLRVVHRVDGAGKDYGRTDGADALQQAVNTLADLTIFQSAYSRHSTRERYGIIGLDGPIIFNPVDTDHYNPQGERLSLASLPAPSPGRWRVVTAIWSHNRRKGAWRIPGLARANPDLDFIFIGNAVFESRLPNLYHLGKLDHVQMAQALRSGDVFLNLSENDPCPNIVLEALASGLPVVYTPSGGTPELVGADGGLAAASDAEVGPAVRQLAQELAQHKTLARQRAVTHFSQDPIFSQYWAAIQASQRRPLPARWRHYFSYGQVARQWVQDKLINYQDWTGRA
jgi:glycosyltransferase involved in cell wall biosynthesis